MQFRHLAVGIRAVCLDHSIFGHLPAAHMAGFTTGSQGFAIKGSEMGCESNCLLLSLDVRLSPDTLVQVAL